jgi:hypothetical protein
MAKLEGGSKGNDVDEAMRVWHERGVGTRLYDAFTVAGLRVDAIEPGHRSSSPHGMSRATISAHTLQFSLGGSVKKILSFDH